MLTYLSNLVRDPSGEIVISAKLIIYVIIAVLMAILMVRLILKQRRKRREQVLLEAARLAGLDPQEAAAAVAAQTAKPGSSATGSTSETTSTTAAAFRSAASPGSSTSDTPGTAASIDVQRGAQFLPVETPSSPEAAATSAPTHREQGARNERTALNRPLFTPLMKKGWGTEHDLPVLEIGETPVADTSDLVFGPLTPTLAAMLPDMEGRREEARKELKNAGFYQPHAYLNLAAVRYVCIMLPMLVMGMLLLVVPPQLEKFVLIGLVGMPLLGWALPRLYVKGRAQDRTSQIERGIPDMLDMLNMCVSQGMPVQASLIRVNQELQHVHPALNKELEIVNEQAQIGTLQVALENFSKRIDVAEVHSFTSLITQTERMGTSVSSALAEYSDNIRASLRQRADERGNQAAFKLLFPTVLCLMPAIYMFLLGPSVVEFNKFLNRRDPTRAQAAEIIQNQGTRTGGPVRNR